MKYDGKTLLVLGSNVSAPDIVKYAKENGAYTIVADYYDSSRSAAKQVCDKDFLISTADLDGLGKIVEDYKVDGILAGISEFNLLKAQELSERYHLPFYCNRQQWNNIEMKNEFRKLCMKFNVPCPKTYFIGEKIDEETWKKIKYPSVIKPVDASTSAGVHICYSENEMRKYEEDAKTKSNSGLIIVEEFAYGDEFTAHYSIANGKAALSAIDNRYPVAVHEGIVTTIPVARIYPCLFIDEFIKQVNSHMIELCEGIGLNNGILFIQGMYDKETNKFNIFEAGLRSAGEAPYRFVSKINGISSISLLIDQALSVETDYQLELEDPYLKGKCCGIVSFVAKGGTVGSIIGLEEAIKNTSSIISYENRYPIGSKTPDGDTLRQLMIRFVMICDNREQMEKDIAYLNNHITVLNDSGEDMVIKMIPERVYKCG